MITAELHPTSVQKLNVAMKLFIEGLGKDAVVVIKDTGKKLALELVDSTPPFGTSNSSKKQGEEAAKRDLLRTITPTNKIFDDSATNKLLNKRLKEITKKKDKEALTAVIGNFPNMKNWQVKDFSPEIHTSRREYGGRYRVDRSMQNATMDIQDHKEYQKSVLGRVGYSKASWGKIAAELGGKTKMWISRHFGYAKGGLLDYTKNPNPTLIMVNRTPNIRRWIGSYKSAINHTADKMLRDLAFKVNYLMKQNKFTK